MKIRELEITGKLLIAGGLVLAISSLFIDARFFYLLSSSNSIDSEIPNHAGELMVAFSMIIGALVISLGILTLAISKNYQENQYSYLIAAFTTWYSIDTFASLALGYEYNAIINTMILTGLVIVLKRVKNRYHN